MFSSFLIMIYNLFIILMKVDYGKIDKGAKGNVLNATHFSLTLENTQSFADCGADVNSLLTNVSRRGRPPKTHNPKQQLIQKK